MDILHHCSDVEMQTPEQTPELTPGSSASKNAPILGSKERSSSKKEPIKIFWPKPGGGCSPPVSFTYATIDREEATMHKEDVARV